MKWRLVVVVGLVAMATGPCCAGGVQPSAGPRFGVEGKRHRMVLPLSAFPSNSPLLHRAVWGVDVTIGDLTPEGPATERMYLGSARAPAIRDVLVRAGGVSVRTNERVNEARAFVLSDPPRLVVDVYPQGAETDSRDGGNRGTLVASGSMIATRLLPIRLDATPRFALHDDRLRMVVPLSSLPAAAPSVHPAVWTVDVMLPGLMPSASTPYRPVSKSASARAVRDALARPGGIALRTHWPVRRARAFLLPEPPRLVIDVYPDEGDESIDVAAPLAAATDAAHEAVSSDDAPHLPAPGEPVQGAAAPRSREQGPIESDRAATASASNAHADVPAYRIEKFCEFPVVWPDLRAPFYARREGPAAAEALVELRREAVAEMRRGRSVHAELPPQAAGDGTSAATDDVRPLPRQAPAPAHYLEADLAYLHAAAGRGDFFSAAALYRRAVRVAPQFADHDRARLMTGFAQLAAGLAPEAEGEFLRIARVARTPAVAALALWAAGRAARTGMENGRAARHLRHAIAADPRSHGACRARSTLGVILAQTNRAAEGLALFEEMQGLCPADVVRAPGTLLNHAGVLAAAGDLQKAEQLLLALPEFHGVAFARRMFLEADVAIATGTPHFARDAYEKIRSRLNLSELVRAEATLRLAQLENQTEHWDQARTLLRQLTSTARSPGLRAKARALEADFLAQRGQYPEALHVLEAVDALGPAGFLAAEQARRKIFRSWIPYLAEQGNNAELLTAFYRYRADGIGRHLRPEDVVRVAEAAVADGLPELAVQILAPVQERLTGSQRATARLIAAEAALAKGEGAHALRLTREMPRAAMSAADRDNVNRLRAHALLRLGRLEEAARLLETLGAPADLIALGRAYLQQEAKADKALEVLQRALAGTGDGSGGQAVPLVEGWLALADAAGRAGKHAAAASALRAAIRARGSKATAGMRYQIADKEAIGAAPEQAASTYARAAEQETDPLFARAAAASAAYYTALQVTGSEL